MSKLTQHKFNLQILKNYMEEWRKAAELYEKSAERSYGLLRSYLTLFQFRLPDAEKHEIRDLLSHFLDELEEKGGFLEDMDSYLEGFFFRPDPSVLKPNAPTSSLK